MPQKSLDKTATGIYIFVDGNRKVFPTDMTDKKEYQGEIKLTVQNTVKDLNLIWTKCICKFDIVKSQNSDVETI